MNYLLEGDQKWLLREDGSRIGPGEATDCEIELWAEVERLQEALRDAIGAKDGWRIRAGKALGDPKV